MKNQDNSTAPFSFKGLNSLLIGLIILTNSYFIKRLLDKANLKKQALHLDNTQQLETIILIITGLTFLLFPIAIYVVEKIKTKKLNRNNVPSTSIQKLLKYTLTLTVLFVLLVMIKQMGFYLYITPLFLLLYGLILVLFGFKEDKNMLLLSGSCLLFAIITLLIPTYWYYALVILGIAHITYGVNN